ncbi:DHH family phosphoesterase [Desulfosarcina sp. OttesenSCG-928-A07]|nr:DHH family phosphoesterase [Desulfosarcina sp. OttesenSCG-928-G17]MDL2328724.1 DHH family phosphoesterase [Desulfosarcina sp. OttesenSCG-928-A07]
MMKSIIRQLAIHNRILLASHTRPDGDAIGALLSMGLALEKKGCQITLYNESSIPAVYRFLPSVHRIREQLPAAAEFDAAVILDCGNLERVGAASAVISRIPVIINIDHHTTNDHFGHYNLVDESACATSEIIFRLVRAMEVEIDPMMATAIYTGILTDTGSFRFPNTNRAAFSICEAMVAAGVQPFVVAQHVYGTSSMGRIRLLNLALDSIEVSHDGHLSIMTVTQDMLKDTGTRPEDTDGLINYARWIQDVEVAVLIRELKNKATKPEHSHFHVSLRSNGDVDVARIAVSFGGGGHAGAAGFSIESELSALKAVIYHFSDHFVEKP